MARTEPGVDGRRAFSLLLVPTDTPGFEIERIGVAMGYDGDHCIVRYHDVRVPASNIIGQRGGGSCCRRRDSEPVASHTACMDGRSGASCL